MGLRPAPKIYENQFIDCIFLGHKTAYAAALPAPPLHPGAFLYRLRPGYADHMTGDLLQSSQITVIVRRSILEILF